MTDQPRSAPHQNAIRRWLLIIGVLIAIGLAIWLGATELNRRAAAARIQALPDLTYEPQPVIDQLQASHARALRRPASPQFIGALAMAYHANTLSRQAQHIYTLAAELDPHNTAWRYYLILLHEEFGESELALNSLREFVQIQPDHAHAWWKLAELEFAAGRDAQALEAYARAAERSDQQHSAGDPRPPVHPLRAYAALGQARIAMRQERWQDAVAILEPVTAQSPHFGAAHRMLSRVFQDMGNQIKADHYAAIAARCLAYAPPVDPMIDRLSLLSRSNTFLLRNASQALNEGDVRWSERLLQQALTYYPGDVDVQGNLVLLLAVTDRLNQATTLLREYLEQNPTDSEHVAKLGSILQSKKHAAEAIQCFQYAAKLNPQRALYRINLGAALASIGEFDAAEQSLRAAIELEPTSFAANYNLTRLLMEAGRYEQAAAQAQQTIALDASNIDLRIWLAQAHERLNQNEQAGQAYEQGATLAANDPQALHFIAHALMRLEQFDRALDVSRMLVNAAPQQSASHLTLVEIAMRANRIDLAREHCEIVLQMQPENAHARQLLSELDRK